MNQRDYHRTQSRNQGTKNTAARYRNPEYKANQKHRSGSSLPGFFHSNGLLSYTDSTTAAKISWHF